MSDELSAEPSPMKMGAMRELHNSSNLNLGLNSAYPFSSQETECMSDPDILLTLPSERKHDK